MIWGDDAHCSLVCPVSTIPKVVRFTVQYCSAGVHTTDSTMLRLLIARGWVHPDLWSHELSL